MAQDDPNLDSILLEQFPGRYTGKTLLHVAFLMEKPHRDLPFATQHQGNCLVNFYGVDLGVVFDGRELNYDLAGGVGDGVDGLDYGFVGGSRGGDDVEVGENRGVVDGDVEDALAGLAPVGFGEVELDDVGAVGGEAGDGVGEVAVAIGPVDGLGGGVGRGVERDGSVGGSGGAAGNVGIGEVVVLGAAAAGVDGDR